MVQSAALAGVNVFAQVRSSPAQRDLENILFSSIGVFIGVCSVVLAYTIIFAAVDMKCDLKVPSKYVCVCVTNLVTGAHTAAELNTHTPTVTS